MSDRAIDGRAWNVVFGGLRGAEKWFRLECIHVASHFIDDVICNDTKLYPSSTAVELAKFLDGDRMK